MATGKRIKLSLIFRVLTRAMIWVFAVLVLDGCLADQGLVPMETLMRHAALLVSALIGIYAAAELGVRYRWVEDDVGAPRSGDPPLRPLTSLRRYPGNANTH